MLYWTKLYNTLTQVLQLYNGIRIISLYFSKRVKNSICFAICFVVIIIMLDLSAIDSGFILDLCAVDCGFMLDLSVVNCGFMLDLSAVDC